MSLIDSFRAIADIEDMAKIDDDRTYWFNSDFSFEIMLKALESGSAGRVRGALKTYPTIDLCCGDITSVRALLELLKIEDYLEYTGVDYNTIDTHSERNIPINAHSEDPFFRDRSFREPNSSYVLTTKELIADEEKLFSAVFDARKMLFYNDDALLFLGFLPDKSVNVILGGLEQDVILRSKNNIYHRTLESEIQRVLAPGAFFMDNANTFEFNISGTDKEQLLEVKNNEDGSIRYHGYLHQSTTSLSEKKQARTMLLRKNVENRFAQISRSIEINTRHRHWVGRDVGQIVASAITDDNTEILNRLHKNSIELRFTDETYRGYTFIDENPTREYLIKALNNFDEIVSDIRVLAEYSRTIQKLDEILPLIANKIYKINELKDKITKLNAPGMMSKYDLLNKNGIDPITEIDFMYDYPITDIEKIIDVNNMLKRFSDHYPTYIDAGLFLQIHSNNVYKTLAELPESCQTIKSLEKSDLYSHKLVQSLVAKVERDELPF